MPRRYPLFSPVRVLRRVGFYRGLLGGNRTWLGVFAVLVGARVLRRAVGRTEQLAAVERLLPGQRLTILAIDPVKERRAAKRR